MTTLNIDSTLQPAPRSTSNLRRVDDTPAYGVHTFRGKCALHCATTMMLAYSTVQGKVPVPTLKTSSLYESLLCWVWWTTFCDGLRTLFNFLCDYYYFHFILQQDYEMHQQEGSALTCIDVLFVGPNIYVFRDLWFFLLCDSKRRKQVAHLDGWNSDDRLKSVRLAHAKDLCKYWGPPCTGVVHNNERQDYVVARRKSE